MNLPNKLTVSRFLITLLFVALVLVDLELEADKKKKTPQESARNLKKKGRFLRFFYRGWVQLVEPSRHGCWWNRSPGGGGIVGVVVLDRRGGQRV